MIITTQHFFFLCHLHTPLLDSAALVNRTIIGIHRRRRGGTTHHHHGSTTHHHNRFWFFIAARVRSCSILINFDICAKRLLLV
jgi:hypothetical protein